MNNTNIHRILIPVDFSPAGECAVERGVYVAKIFHADIFMLHVLEAADIYPHEWSDTGSSFNSKDLIHEKVDSTLREYAENIMKNYGVHVQTSIATGKPANKIVEAVKERDIDLIVMGTHGAGGFEEYFIGSNAHKVVNLSPCPVITIRQGSNVSGIKSIVLPIDDCLHSRQKLNNILAIASRCSAVVYILGLVQRNDISDITKINSKIDTVEKLIHNAGLACTRKILKGDNIAAEAMKYATEVNADMLAILTDHESTLTSMFMGAFAQQIINHSRIPVISIKPVKSTYEFPT